MNKLDIKLDAEFLGYFVYDYPRPSITVDICVFTQDCEHLLEVLLIERGGEPYKGKFALPGGYMNIDETLLDAAKRELLEETGIITDLPLDFCFVADKIHRDTRGRVLTAVFATEFERKPECKAGDDAANLKWVDMSKALEMDLAFDHNEILEKVWVYYK